MIRIAVCDDDVKTLDTIRKIAEGFSQAYPQFGCAVRSFSSVFDLMECIETGSVQFDIYVLDIMMPLINGIEVGKQIRKSDGQALIIYLTSSSEFALASFQAMPFQYLLKPVKKDTFTKVLEMACAKIGRSREAGVLVETKEGLVNMRYHQIAYMEYKDHAVVFHTDTGNSFATKTMRQSFSDFTHEYLKDKRFIKPHSAYVVNMDHVQMMRQNQFQLMSGKMIPISNRVYAEVKKQFIDYMLSRNKEPVL